ncbi:hypothetical protein ACWDBF_17150 [Streptomyces angustmyceticus]
MLFLSQWRPFLVGSGFVFDFGFFPAGARWLFGALLGYRRIACSEFL